MVNTDSLSIAAHLRRGEFVLDVAVEVAPGETLGVIGPNGAGKTTLLRAVAGLTALDRGRIALGSTVWDDPAQGVFVDPTMRECPVVFQDYRLFPHLSVLDNVAYPHRARGASRAAARDRARHTVERLGLAELSARLPRELSGGQAQRAAMARALTTEPRAILLDERLSALDARTRQQTRIELKQVLADFAGPTLLITHDPLEAMTLADRLLVLEGGTVTQLAAPREVAAQPVSDYVARLVGINLYQGTLVAPGSVALSPTGGSLRTTSDASDGVPLGQPTLVALAPSAIAVHLDRPTALSAQNVWAGRIRAVETLRDRIRLDVDGAPPALVDITPAAFAQLGLDLGTEVWLSAKATEVIAYGAQPG